MQCILQTADLAIIFSMFDCEGVDEREVFSANFLSNHPMSFKKAYTDAKIKISLAKELAAGT